MEQLHHFVTTGFYAYFLVFARLLAVFIFVPGFGERFLMPQLRVLMAMVFSFVLTPLAIGYLPPMPENFPALFMLLAGELLIGAFLGFISRLFIYALETAGAIISQAIGMSNVMVTTPVSEQQASIMSGFLALAGMMIIFSLNMHHFFIMGTIKSYQIFAAGELPHLAQFSQKYVELVSSTFKIAVVFSAPFLVIGLVFFMGMGMLSRLVTQIQIFFIAMPLQLLLGIAILFISLTSLFMWYTQEVEEMLPQIWGGA